MAILEVEGVDTFYGRSQALRQVSLHVDQGEIVALIGSNGAGKTTTLRTISGLVPPAAGRISFQGTDITRLQASRVARLGLGQSPEGRRLFSRMSVTDNLLVEQNANKALQIAHRGYVLETGVIVQEGPGRELLDSEDVRRAYLGM